MDLYAVFCPGAPFDADFICSDAFFLASADEVFALVLLADFI